MPRPLSPPQLPVRLLKNPILSHPPTRRTSAAGELARCKSQWVKWAISEPNSSCSLESSSFPTRQSRPIPSPRVTQTVGPLSCGIKETAVSFAGSHLAQLESSSALCCHCCYHLPLTSLHVDEVVAGLPIL